MIRNEGNKLNLPEIISADGWYAVDCAAFSTSRVKLRLLKLEYGEDVSAEELLAPLFVSVDVADHFLFEDDTDLSDDSLSNAVHEYMTLLRKEGYL